MIAVKPKVFKKGRKQRHGKGFSREELKEVGLGLREALRRHIPADVRRRTVHKENVEVLKSFLGIKSVRRRSRRKSKS